MEKLLIFIRPDNFTTSPYLHSVLLQWKIVGVQTKKVDKFDQILCPYENRDILCKTAVLQWRIFFGNLKQKAVPQRNHHLFGDWGNTKKKVVRCFPLSTQTYPSITSSRTWEPLVNLSLPALLTSCYIRGNFSMICWTRKYYLCSNTHVYLYLLGSKLPCSRRQKKL